MSKRIIHLKQNLVANIKHKWTLQEMGNEVNLSVSHLRMLFRTINGLPPLRFLRHERLKKARNLLESTSLSVKEVRNEVGMSDPAHFSRGFKEMFGSTPSVYRNLFRKTYTRAKIRITR